MRKILFRFLYRVFCGFFLGLSVFAPGLSGSVVAIGMGVYQDLLRVIANPFRDFRKNAVFCAPLLVGAAVAAVLFALSFGYLFEAHEKLTSFLFIGLIAGNLPAVFGEMGASKPAKRHLLTAAAVGLAVAAFGLLVPAQPVGETGVFSPAPLFALGGFAGGVSALVPGMSVSLVLMLMKLYGQLLHIANEIMRMRFTYLPLFALFTLCAVVGLMAVSALLRLVFAKCPAYAYAVVLGFIVGSLATVTIQALNMPGGGGFSPLAAAALCAGGFAAGLLFTGLKRVMTGKETEAGK
ncbi:MAG: DUF368 domain-containing protein [Oscillospiraceae bacterium]|jgi:putative membrane protein|nr:DUF368 domain-containing protein [Oscillospiraceae bacterium]